MIRKLTTSELNRPAADQYKNLPKNSLIVILENVRSAHNVGAAFRSCDAFGVEKIFLCGFTPVPPSREIQKTALGATESVPWEYHHSPEGLIGQLKNAGYKIFAVEQTTESLKLQYLQLGSNEKTAFIFGNEVRGVEQGTLELCDGSIEIEQVGTKHSLNVAVCVGIVLWKACDLIRVSRGKPAKN